MEVNYITYFSEFEREYEVLSNSSEDVFSVSLEIIRLVETKLKVINGWLKKYDFQSMQEEIHFFKELRPRMVSKLLYYKALMQLETSLAPTKRDQKKQYEKLLAGIHQYSRSNRELYEYYRSRTTHKDADFFTRRSYKDIINYDCCLINYDSKISTSHDYKMANFMANDMLTRHLENRLDELECRVPGGYKVPNHNLSWTGTKIELVEIIYGIYYKKMLNHGKADIKEIARVVCRAFNVALSDQALYRCLQDIKRRFPECAVFLRDLYEVSSTQFRGEDY